MKKYIVIIMTIAILCLTAFGGALPAAADTPPVITVTSSEPLYVGGVIISQFPVTVAPNTVISIVNPVYYTSQGERYSFTGWSNGSVSSSITLTDAGTYSSVWAHEILVVVNSVVTSLQQSPWLPYGQPYKLSAPLTDTQGGNVEYDFQKWDGGQTPFAADNTIIPFQTMTINALYTEKFLLTLVTPDGITALGGGWYNAGTSVVLQTPKDVYTDTAQDSRQDFSGWESIGATPVVLSSPASAVTTIAVNGPYVLQADYNQQYLVTATSPFGVLNHDWVNEGATEQFSAPATQAVVTDLEQYAFQKWTGMAGLTSPQVGGVVSGPIALVAVYTHQYKVTLVDPYGGSGGGWITAGSMDTITVPTTNQKNLILKSRFTGFAGYSGKANTIQVLVNAPVTVTALYTTGIDFGVLGIIVLAVLVIAALWIFGRRITLSRSAKPKDTPEK
jgi:hypothetical protein